MIAESAAYLTIWVGGNSSVALQPHIGGFPGSLKLLIPWLLRGQFSFAPCFVKHWILYEFSCPVGLGSRIHWLLLCKGVRPTPWIWQKQSDGEVPVIVRLCGIRNTPSLLSLLGPVWPRVLTPDKDPIYGSNRTKPQFLELIIFSI